MVTDSMSSSTITRRSAGDVPDLGAFGRWISEHGGGKFEGFGECVVAVGFDCFGAAGFGCVDLGGELAFLFGEEVVDDLAGEQQVEELLSLRLLRKLRPDGFD